MRKTRWNRMMMGLLAGIMAGAMLVMSACQPGNTNDPTTASADEQTTDTGATALTEAGIYFKLTTDKSAYNEGEPIQVSIDITNNKQLYTISLVKVTAVCDKNVSGELPSFDRNVAYGDTTSFSTSLTVDTTGMTMSEVTDTGMMVYETTVNSEDTSATGRPYAIVNYGGNDVTIRYVIEVNYYQNKVTINAADTKKVNSVSVHDPSIVVGTDPEGQKCYYIFGSHLAFAKSYDLENWKTFSVNINKEYKTLFAEPASWAAHGSSSYDVSGMMWAPDVIWNEAMGKWCMYMSINGDAWCSSICMLTADSLEGDWSYAGEVIYSGFYNDAFYDETDVAAVTGEATRADRYTKSAWGNNYPNMIDPCVFYDEEGKLWMSYGSWSGGIFIIELDEETGFRDTSVTYPNDKHSDPYFGTKIAGGQYVSGEASYIEYIDGYYWLFISYGNLEAAGGYNVRVFRSERPNGGYEDEQGNSPYYDTYVQNYNDSVGVRLFGGYKWRTMQLGEVAQGHNSAFVDEDGKAYIVYHTRTTDGSEGHHVEVHQLFTNEDGWLVAAPYAYAGETLPESGLATTDIAGEYEIILHELSINYKEKETKKVRVISLNEDGSVTGDLTGSWNVQNGTPYIDLVLGTEEYHGVALEMDIEDTTISTVVFTALGKNTQYTLWGSKSIEQ